MKVKLNNQFDLIDEIYIPTLQFILYPVYYLMQKLLIKFCKKNNSKKKYSISICCIFKNEKKYLEEWIEYYRLIGVEHFYLFDNNSTDEPLELLQKYIDVGIVTFEKYTETGKAYQAKGYSYFYNKYGKESSWIGFLDVDEFVVPKSTNFLIDFLKNYEKYPAIAIYWKMFGTSGLLDSVQGKTVIEQFTVAWQRFHYLTKTFINTRYDSYNYDFGPIHTPRLRVFNKIYIFPVNECKKFIFFNKHPVSRKFSLGENKIQINHYFSKSVNEYVHDKGARGNGYTENFYGIDKLIQREIKNSTSDFSIFKYVTLLKMRLLEPDVIKRAEIKIVE